MEQNNHLTNFIKALHTEQETKEKNHLTYVSWANAWKEFKKIYPLATYEVVKFDGVPYQDLKDRGTMVFTRITADGITYEMWLPVMDYSNKIVKTPDLIAINKTIMRCLTKNIAMFGIGLYVYAGEDLPEPEVVNTLANLPPVKKAVAPVAPTPRVTTLPTTPKTGNVSIETNLGNILLSAETLDGVNEIRERDGQDRIIPLPPERFTQSTTSTQTQYDEALAKALKQEVNSKPLSAGRTKLNNLLDKHITYSIEKLKVSDEKKATSILSSQKLNYTDATDDQQIKRLAWISEVLKGEVK